ncbi:cryptochrome/photolyase family protein [Methylophilus aquaticus]|uniref:Cryptochrome/photolyase family protein n=1 Tax=Methylophilus aquaticus TaxID=1971610 RepID=A0ABT9JTZ5_9PROT|nr:cryptochrome/photolyase family protein [Methylophilus aquaticus]MDP8567994.1 cryptochrome/photolyase family protein [Methylophilus aquaticus]
MPRLIVILGDQLSLDNPALADIDPAQDHIVMAEVMEESTHVWSHPQRITLFLSAMRHFAAQLDTLHLPLTYFRLESHGYPDLTSVWIAMIARHQPQSLVVCEPGDWRVKQALLTVAEQCQCTLDIRPDTHFMCSTAQFQQWAANYTKKQSSLRMEFFYRHMRRQYGILMQGDAPVGGDWNYDQENRQSIDKHGPQGLTAPLDFLPDSITQTVMAQVATRFADHPGVLDNFGWPVTRVHALQLLAQFIQYKLPVFGPYQDAMWQNEPTLWHSLLASALNLKLLNPREVIAAAEQAYRNGEVPLASAEGFIRQILGWREFIRGMYWLDMPAMKSANFFAHTRALPAWFWTGKTGMQCLAQTIGQTLQTGYAHHIQRLMVTGLFATLAELSPQQVADWYLAVYVDAVEWVELPNVAGMALYANGGRFTSKPYVASGAYIQRMSNYCEGCRYNPTVKTGERACPFTTLYWAFLIKHEALFNANPRTRLMVRHVTNMTTEARMAITAFAEKRLMQIAEL